MPLRLQYPERRPHAAERSRQRDVEHLGPLLVGHVDDVGGAAESGVVDHDVEATQRCQRGVEQPLHLPLIGDVADQRRGGTELGRGFAQSALVGIADDDDRAFFDAALGRGVADARTGGRGHEDALAVEQVVAADVVHRRGSYARRLALTAFSVSSLTPRPAT